MVFLNFIDGSYLDNEICAFSGNENNMWFIVFDGSYNYYLFDFEYKRIRDRFKRGRMPYNDSGLGIKMCEYYSNFDNAIERLMKLIINNRFIK